MRPNDCLDTGLAGEGLKHFSRLCFVKDRGVRPDEELRDAEKGSFARNDV